MMLVSPVEGGHMMLVSPVERGHMMLVSPVERGHMMLVSPVTTRPAAPTMKPLGSSNYALSMGKFVFMAHNQRQLPT